VMLSFGMITPPPFLFFLETSLTWSTLDIAEEPVMEHGSIQYIRQVHQEESKMPMQDTFTVYIIHKICDKCCKFGPF
jgi:hypothetical protein